MVYFKFYPLFNIIEASRGAGAHSVTVKSSGCGFGPHCRSIAEMKYLFTLMFSFLRSGVEAKSGVEFRHSTRNASRSRRKVGNGVSYTRFPLPTLLCAGYSVKLIKFDLIF